MNDIITIVFILVIHLSHICYLNMQSNWHQTAFKVQWGCQGDQTTTNPQKSSYFTDISKDMQPKLWKSKRYCSLSILIYIIYKCLHWSAHYSIRWLYRSGLVMLGVSVSQISSEQTEVIGTGFRLMSYCLLGEATAKCHSTFESDWKVLSGICYVTCICESLISW